MTVRHQVIPIFIPQKACPYRCIYCNQFAIAGQTNVPTPDEAERTIQQYLATLSPESEKRIAFFGGSFTGMSLTEQTDYLQKAYPYLHHHNITGIQLSTRPDYINPEILENLKRYGVTLIELGAQSLDDCILLKAGRGHTVAQVEEASRMILQNGFQLGLQMMIGLPGDSKATALQTARKIVQLGAAYTRIYPTLVVHNTLLAQWFQQGLYQPLSIENAVDWCKDIYSIFVKHHVNVLRVGLHPSAGLLSGTDYIAGPFHVSFKELVLTAIWHDRIHNNPAIQHRGTNLQITVHPSQLNYVIGYQSSNKKQWQLSHPQLSFATDDSLDLDAFKIITIPNKIV